MPLSPGVRGKLTTPALSSKYKNTPSGLLHGLLCLTTTAGITFFLNSGFPFLTVAITMSPTPAAGRRLSRAPIPLTDMMYRLRAPELSQQFITAPLMHLVSGRSELVLAPNQSCSRTEFRNVHGKTHGHLELVARRPSATVSQAIS